MRTSHALIVALALLLSVRADAQSPDPFTQLDAADPFDLARVAHTVRDRGVLAHLTEQTPVVQRLAAVRATPFMHAPERALAVLSGLARGRDPDLAPVAMDAARTITRALDGPALDRREVPRAELREARAGFAQVAADVTAREDLRAAARVVVDALAQLGVPE